MRFWLRVTMLFIIIFCLPSVFGGLIDPRFPDYIVDPLVPCQADGYFEHPRNCSWFYRCHSSENITGFYRRDYFECAPGTVFSNEASVCDVGSLETCKKTLPDCSSCNIANVNVQDNSCGFFELCPDEHNKVFKIGVNLCSNPKYGCEKCSHLSPCKDEEWLLVTSEKRRSSKFRNSFPIQCHPSPYLPQMQCPITLPSGSCRSCYNSVEDCLEYNVCPDGVNSISLTLCAIAKRVCQFCPTKNLCAEGDYFDNVEQTCYPSPKSPPMQCPSPTTDVVPEIACDNCTITTGFCNPIVVCPNGADPVSKNLCALAIKECSTCDVKQVMCPEQNSYFLVEDQECIAFPISSEWQCPSTESPVEGLPTEGLPTEALPTEALPTEALPTEVLPTEALPTEALPTEALPTEELPTGGTATEALPIEASPVDVLTTEVSPTERPTEPPCTDCFIDASRCETHTVCPYGEPPTSMRLCRAASRTCDPCGSKENICRKGDYYSMDRTSCFPNPNSNAMQCKGQNRVRDSSTNKQSVTLKKPPVIECSGKNLLPQDKWIKEKFCRNYQPCFRGIGRPFGIIELCTSYFECVYDVFHRDWNVVKSHCSEKKLFSYEAQSCVSEPVDICRVF